MRSGARCLCLLVALGGTLGAGVCVGAPAEVPAHVLQSAEAATKVLGDQILKGNYSFAVQKLYPRYKARAAKREGGMENLVRKLSKTADEMRKNGVALLDFSTRNPTKGHEVRGVRVETEAGQTGRVYAEWLVFVPTARRLKVMEPGKGMREVESKSFQIAIANKDKMEWSFINGVTLSIAELRSLFPSLPEDLEELGVPEVGLRVLD